MNTLKSDTLTASPNTQPVSTLITNGIMRLCVASLKTNTEVKVAQQMIILHKLQPDETAVNLENWPWRIRVYTLGLFAVEIDGLPLVLSRKKQKKPLELLKALIAFGGHGVSKEQLAETLWPDADGDEAQQSLSITLHRLRKLLGNEVIVLQQGKLSLSASHCWTDIRSLEHHLIEASNKLQQDRLQESWQTTQKALHLYKGAFLANEAPSYWALSKSERLRRKLLNHIDSMASRLSENNQHQQAITVYSKGLDVDDLQEAFYRGLIHCHQQLGQKAEALAVYRQCALLMHSVFGHAPSDETRMLLNNAQ